MMSRRKFTKELKLTAVERLRAGELAGLLARGLEVNRKGLWTSWNGRSAAGAGSSSPAGAMLTNHNRPCNASAANGAM